MPAVSPDGAQLAYVSNSTGGQEIYVRPYPGPGSPVQVSEHGGTEPRWSRDGHQLFYQSGNELLAATIASTSPFAVAGHASLFKRTFDGDMPHANFDPSVDGKGVVMIGAAEGVDREMAVVVNWLAELRTRLAANDAH
jgi:hypothetical protein